MSVLSGQIPVGHEGWKDRIPLRQDQICGGRIKYVAEDQRYFLFVLSNSHAQAYDKKRLTGGDAGEFRSFIEDRTGLKVIPVSGRF